jgi:hypothetical protein
MTKRSLYIIIKDTKQLIIFDLNESKFYFLPQFLSKLTRCCVIKLKYYTVDEHFWANMINSSKNY